MKIPWNYYADPASNLCFDNIIARFIDLLGNSITIIIQQHRPLWFQYFYVIDDKQKSIALHINVFWYHNLYLKVSFGKAHDVEHLEILEKFICFISENFVKHIFYLFDFNLNFMPMAKVNVLQ